MIKTPFIGRVLHDLLVPCVPEAKYQPLKFEHGQKAKFRNYNLSVSLFHLFRFSRPLVFLSLDIFYASFRWEKFLEKLLES